MTAALRWVYNNKGHFSKKSTKNGNFVNFLKIFWLFFCIFLDFSKTFRQNWLIFRMRFLITALNKSPFMKLEIEIFFVALLARSGKSKISFWQYLGFSADFFVGLHKNKNSCRKKSVGVSPAQLFIKIIRRSRISKKMIFRSGNIWPYFKSVLRKVQNI